MYKTARTLLGSLLAIVACSASAASSDAMPTVATGFRMETIAHIDSARELAVTPNGDLLVGTLDDDVMIVPGADATPGTPSVFATFPDRYAAGIALAADALYVGTHAGVWKIPYATGDRRASGDAKKLAAVRTTGQGGHSTTSVAVFGERLYVGVGSSCNACVETDSSRATVDEIATSGGTLQLKAKRIRNAIALAIDPTTHDLWAGVAGQDDLAHGHPFEIFDDVTAHAGVADYGWPQCYENRQPTAPRNDCANVAEPQAVFPAYETPIGAAFYAPPENARYAFGAAYRDGAFVTLHGSWHRPLVAPRVVFVSFVDGKPKRAIDWNEAGAQWKPFLEGFQTEDGTRIARPTGVAVGPDGSLFVSDDQNGAIYRIRPMPKS